MMKKANVAVFVFLSMFTMVASSAFASEAYSHAKEEMRKIIQERNKEAASESSESGMDKILDLNNATKMQLMSLPGISADYAEKIIAGRPYQDKTQLRERNILPADVFYQIVDRVTIKYKNTQVYKPVVETAPVKKTTKPKTKTKDLFKAIKMD